jgi:putative redox protein
MQPFDENVPAVRAELTGAGRFQTRIALRGGTILADEPVEVGGLAPGPTPYELLSASLAACTAMTMRLYAERKGWELPPFEIEVTHVSATGPTEQDRFTRSILFEGELDEERRARLIDIANRCPVHRTLERGFGIDTSLSGRAPAAEPSGQHLLAMEAACAD